MWQADYAPFGEATPIVEDVEQLLRFPGQRLDSESGLHYNYQRFYDPSTGRYLRSDPIGLAGGVNTYVYVTSNPLTQIDRTGEFGVPGAVIGAIAGGLGAYIQRGECATLADILLGAGVGAATGFVGAGIGSLEGAIGGATGGGLAAITGTSAAVLGSYGGQIAIGGVGKVSHGAAIGTGLGGAFGGAYAAMGAGVAGEMLAAQIALTGGLIGASISPTLDESLGREPTKCKCSK